MRLPPAERGRELALLTGAKWTTNVGLRWISAFLPTLERTFGASTGTLTTIMGVAELSGLSTPFTGRLLDRGHERRMIVAGLLLVAASGLIALGGTTWTFAIAFTALVLGVGNATIAGHAWIGHRYGFLERGRAIGTFEMSWALSLLIGAPLVALAIRGFGWWAPFLGVSIGAALAAVMVVRYVTAGTQVAAADIESTGRLARSAYPPMIASAATAAAGLGIFVVSGAWLDDRHGVSTAGLGLIAAMYGAVELASSAGVALVSDRVGSRRSVLAGLGGLLAGCAVMAASGDSRLVAVAGILLFLTGFEYAFVASLTLVTEAAPEARGRAIGVSNAYGTLARAGSVIVSGRLYEAYGIGGSLTWVAAAAGLAIVMATFTTTGRAGTP